MKHCNKMFVFFFSFSCIFCAPASADNEARAVRIEAIETGQVPETIPIDKVSLGIDECDIFGENAAVNNVLLYSCEDRLVELSLVKDAFGLRAEVSSERYFNFKFSPIGTSPFGSIIYSREPNTNGFDLAVLDRDSGDLYYSDFNGLTVPAVSDLGTAISGNAESTVFTDFKVSGNISVLELNSIVYNGESYPIYRSRPISFVPNGDSGYGFYTVCLENFGNCLNDGNISSSEKLSLLVKVNHIASTGLSHHVLKEYNKLPSSVTQVANSWDDSILFLEFDDAPSELLYNGQFVLPKDDYEISRIDSHGFYEIIQMSDSSLEIFNPWELQDQDIFPPEPAGSYLGRSFVSIVKNKDAWFCRLGRFDAEDFLSCRQVIATREDLFGNREYFGPQLSFGTSEASVDQTSEASVTGGGSFYAFLLSLLCLYRRK